MHVKSTFSLFLFAPAMIAAIPAAAITLIEDHDQRTNPNTKLYRRDDDEEEEGEGEDDNDVNNTVVRPVVSVPPVMNTIAVTSVVTSISVPSAVTITNALSGIRSTPTDYPRHQHLKGNGNSYSVTSEQANSGTTPQPVVKTDKNHTKMELGIAFGVVSIFLLFGVFIFVYYRMKGRRSTPNILSFLGRFNRGKGVENPAQQTDYFRQPVLDTAMPKKPEPALTEKYDVEAAPLSRSSSGSSRASRRSNPSPDRRRTRGDLQPMIMSTSPPRYLDRVNSQRSDRSIRSSRSSGLPIGGPKLPRIPSENRQDPFADTNASQDPFADHNDAKSVSSNNSVKPPPLRLATKDLSLKKATLDRTKSNASNLILTDPRVVDNRVLHIANSESSASSPPPLPPMVKQSKEPKKRFRSDFPFLHLPANPKQGGLGSHFSWTTKSEETPAPSVYRKSNISSTSTDSNPQFRGVNSWVDHQSNRVIRHPSEVPEYAKTVTDYDARSDNSGLDTRRTYYENV